MVILFKIDGDMFKETEPAKMAAYLDQNIKNLNLSQGQKQIFCVIRAILKDSKIYIIDEATSSLDI